jgi:hypothetical protein
VFGCCILTMLLSTDVVVEANYFELDDCHDEVEKH